MITEIKYGSKWTALEELTIGIDSSTRNPNTTALKIVKGTTLIWEDDSPNGNVWFNVEIGGEKHRGKIQCGAITNAIKRGKISLLDNGRGITAYKGDYLQRLLAI